jgi:hypothetical protein
MFLVHPKPPEGMEKVYEEIANDTVTQPGTWEAQLSAGGDKAKVFTELLTDGKLGALALLRNLRNMTQSGVSPHLVRSAMAQANWDRVYPYQLLTAAAAAPEYSVELEAALHAAVRDVDPMTGRTAVLVDVSGSMDSGLSARGVSTRMDAGCGLALLAMKYFEECEVYSFSTRLEHVPKIFGLEMSTRIKESQPNAGTHMAEAIREGLDEKWGRVVVLTDEPATGAKKLPKLPSGCSGYLINLAPYRTGVEFPVDSNWVRINGWTPSVLRYIDAYE